MKDTSFHTVVSQTTSTTRTTNSPKFKVPASTYVVAEVTKKWLKGYKEAATACYNGAVLCFVTRASTPTPTTSVYEPCLQPVT